MRQIFKMSLNGFVLRLLVLTSCCLLNDHRTFGFVGSCDDVKSSYTITKDLNLSAEDTQEIQNSFSAFQEKLDKILANHRSNSRHEVPDVVSDSPSPCLDLTSGQSVLTQLCDKISRLEKRLVHLEANNHQVYTAPSSKNKYSYRDGREPLKEGSDDRSQRYPENHILRNEGALSTNLNFLREEVEKLQRKCAFHATLVDPVSDGMSEVKLTGFTAPVNLGQGLNADNGTFEVPWDGLYYFTVSFLKDKESSYPLTISLVIDDVSRIRGQDEQQAFVNFMTSLRKGQKVWPAITTETSSSGATVIFTFSGFLI